MSKLIAIGLVLFLGVTAVVAQQAFSPRGNHPSNTVSARISPIEITLVAGTMLETPFVSP